MKGESSLLNKDYYTFQVTTVHGTTLDVYVGNEDIDKIKSYNWHSFWKKDIQNYYIVTTVYDDPDNPQKCRSILLHRLVTDAPKGTYVDHRNHNPQDNRKENLRITNNPNNSAHRKGANSNNKTGVRNVHYCKRYKDEYIYKVQIMKNGVMHCWEFALDQFDEACRFAEKMRKKLFGEFAGEG